MTNDYLRKLAEKATKGPWHEDDVNDNNEFEVFSSPHNCQVAIITLGEMDAKYIAAANPQTILSLLDENERLRKALRYLQEIIPRDIAVATGSDITIETALLSTKPMRF